MIGIHHRFVYFITFFFCVLSLVTTGCQREGLQQDPVPADSALVRADLIGEYSAADIRNRFGNNPVVGAQIRHNLKVYKLVYNTQGVDGQPIQASGALLVPVVNIPLPLVSQQHGTITDDRSAPSNYNQGSEAWSLGSAVAASGYVVSAPDYIGYGESKSLPHPYEHAASLASASADMLRAAREFCAKQQIQLNNKLFLTGYSEGGYATMALHRHLETNLSNEFAVTASAPGAGAYHKTAFAKHILSTDKPLNFINSYLWVLQTYNRVYGLDRPWSFYLQEPHASQVQQKGVWASVNRNPQVLFSHGFRQGVQNETDEQLLRALRDNDLHDWRPRAPVALFHGTADDYVPFFNSENAYRAMQANGATNVQLVPLEGRNHSSAVPEFIFGVVAFFSSH